MLYNLVENKYYFPRGAPESGAERKVETFDPLNLNRVIPAEGLGENSIPPFGGINF